MHGVTTNSCRYREPTHLPLQAERARAEREAQEKMRQDWLTPQLHEAWAPGPAHEWGKQPGREVVSVERKGEVKVRDDEGHVNIHSPQEGVPSP